MNCTEMEQLLLLKDSGELPESRQLMVAQHLKTCGACRQLLSDLEAIRGLMNKRSAAQTGPTPQILAEIHRAATHPASPKLRLLTSHWSIAMAAAAVILLCVTMLRFPGTQTTSSPEALAMEVIPLIAIITGSDPALLLQEEDDAGLNVIANELLRLQEIPPEGSVENGENITLPADYQPTTLQWNNTHGSQSGRYG